MDVMHWTRIGNKELDVRGWVKKMPYQGGRINLEPGGLGRPRGVDVIPCEVIDDCSAKSLGFSLDGGFGVTVRMFDSGGRMKEIKRLTGEAGRNNSQVWVELGGAERVELITSNPYNPEARELFRVQI